MPNPAPGFARKPDHKVEIDPAPVALKLTLNGAPVADTARAVTLRESGYPDRLYLPLEDVAPGVLTPVSDTTHCPFKGDARYWRLSAGGETLDRAVWAYDRPYDECEAIRGLVCFDAARLDPA